MPKLTCPLCQHSDIQFYHEDKRRQFHQCQRCDLVFVDGRSLPSAEREKQEYDLHENNAEDEGYRRFLQRAMAPVTATVTPPAKGLDFGCGPAPVLAGMLSESGYHMSVYDPFYADDSTALETSRYYDFITCTEAIEHFHTPHREISLLTRLLAANGVLVIMTKRVESALKFASWHYKNDLTHVSFFSDQTFAFIGKQYGYDVTLYSKDVVLLKKHSQIPGIIR